MKYLVESTVGQHAKGAHVTDSDFPEGRAEELARRGVLTPTDGEFATPLDSDDIEGLRRRCKALEAQNHKLRTASAGAEQAQKITDLDNQVAELTSDVTKLQNMNKELSEGVVTKAVHQNLQDQFDQLKRLHESGGDGLDSMSMNDLRAKAKELGLGTIAVGTSKASLVADLREFLTKAD